MLEPSACIFSSIWTLEMIAAVEEHCRSQLMNLANEALEPLDLGHFGSGGIPVTKAVDVELEEHGLEIGALLQ